MGAAHGNAGLEAHQFGQHFGAAHHRQVAAARLHQLGIVRLHGRGNHHNLRRAEILGVMADRDAMPCLRRRATL
jgi:hypothetical protein